MRSALVLAIVIVSGCRVTAAPVADRSCRMWQLKVLVGPRDSLVATPVLTMTKRGKRSLKFADRAPLAVRELGHGGDSVIMQIGPYRSILDHRQMVTTRAIAHFKDSTMTGLLHAYYASGKVLNGKLVGTCGSTPAR